MGIAQVERHIPFPGPLLAQHFGQLSRIGEGLAKQQSSPTAIHHGGPIQVQIGARFVVPPDQGGMVSLNRLISMFIHGSGPSRLLRSTDGIGRVRSHAAATTAPAGRPATAWSRATV